MANVTKQRSINGDLKKKNRRGVRKHNVQYNLSLVGVNSNGISSKLKSLDHIIRNLKPSTYYLSSRDKS